MGYRTILCMCLLAAISFNFANATAAETPLAKAAQAMRDARVERDKAEKKLKSALSFMQTAQIGINRAQTELNAACGNYDTHDEHAFFRVHEATLARIQEDIDRAQRHLCEAKEYYEQKLTLVIAAQKEFDDAAQQYDESCDELARIRSAMELAEKEE